MSKNFIKDSAVSVTRESRLEDVGSFSKEDVEEAEKIFFHENRLSSSLNARLIAMISLVGVFGTGMYVSICHSQSNLSLLIMLRDLYYRHYCCSFFLLGYEY